MLFHIKQMNTPETCPYGKGGSGSLRDETVPGVKLLGAYGAFMEHTIYMIVETADIDALNRFLLPGMQTCTTEITPVSDHPMR